MTKWNQKTIRTVKIVSFFIFLAYLFRLLGNQGIYPFLLGVLRSFIYLILFFVWGISLRNRIIQIQARRFLSVIAFLIVFWFLVRTMKFHFVSEVLYPNLFRHLWYSYYLPMMFIPLYTAFVALSMGKPEDYRLPGWKFLLGIPTAVLFLLVIFNDFHQMVFLFPEGDAAWSDEFYEYGFLYYVVIGWLVFCGVFILVTLYRKCRIPGSRKRILLPGIPIIVLLFYFVLHYSEGEWFRVVAGDVTAVICLMYAATIELCIQCGLIQANTHYKELFDASTVGAQILDEKQQVCLTSQTSRPMEEDLVCQVIKGPVLQEDGMRISSAPIHGGYVVWAEDMSPLLKVLSELKEVKENLEDSNGILEEENAVKAREAHIMEQDRLYTMIQNETRKQIDLMDQLILQVEKEIEEEKQIGLLKKMLVIGAYLKRRSNLVFLTDKTPLLDPKEIWLTFGESMENLEMYGVTCGLDVKVTSPVLGIHLMTMYDFLEEIMERSLDCMTTLIACVVEKDDGYWLTINTDATVDFSDFTGKGIQVRQDEDKEWKLSLFLRRGGDET